MDLDTGEHLGAYSYPVTVEEQKLTESEGKERFREAGSVLLLAVATRSVPTMLLQNTPPPKKPPPKNIFDCSTPDTFSFRTALPGNFPASKFHIPLPPLYRAPPFRFNAHSSSHFRPPQA